MTIFLCNILHYYMLNQKSSVYEGCTQQYRPNLSIISYFRLNIYLPRQKGKHISTAPGTVNYLICTCNTSLCIHYHHRCFSVLVSSWKTPNDLFMNQQKTEIKV